MSALEEAIGDSIESVVFDFDGVIVDSDELHWRAYRLAFEPFGIDFSLDDYVSGAKGRGRGDVVDRFGAGLSARDRARVAETKGEEALRLMSSGLVAPVEGVVDFIQDLRARSVPCAVASTSEIAAVAVGALGLSGLFECVYARRADDRPKPHPDVFLRALRRIDMPAWSCLVVEDTPLGARAARDAGTQVVIRGRATDWRDEPIAGEVLGFFSSYPELQQRLGWDDEAKRAS